MIHHPIPLHAILYMHMSKGRGILCRTAYITDAKRSRRAVLEIEGGDYLVRLLKHNDMALRSVRNLELIAFVQQTPDAICLPHASSYIFVARYTELCRPENIARKFRKGQIIGRARQNILKDIRIQDKAATHSETIAGHRIYRTPMN